MIPKKLDEIFNNSVVSNNLDNNRVIVDKVNEIIDYLSDKKEASAGGQGGTMGEVYTCSNCGNVHLSSQKECPLKQNKEASKGECGCQGLSTPKGGLKLQCKCGRVYLGDDKPFHFDNPPQQEESRGECGHHHNFKKENGDCVMCVLDKPKYSGWYCQEPECGFVCYMASENDIKEHVQTHNPQLKEESPKEDEYPGKDAGNIWRAVKDELEKDGFKLPTRWKSVGTAYGYGCFVKIQEILDKKYVSKVKIKRARMPIHVESDGNYCSCDTCNLNRKVNYVLERLIED